MSEETQEYIKFCNKFARYRIPKVSFKDLDDTYKILYREYGIEKSTIDKATSIVLILSLIGSLIISFLIMSEDPLICIVFSFIIAGVLAYNFNIYLYKKINKQETEINASIYFIKINFSLLQKVLAQNSDLAIAFIKLMRNLNLPFSALFKHILRRIQQGYSPERELEKILTPSSDFNKYLRKLLLSDFKEHSLQDSVRDYALENQFKTYLKGLEGKLAIIFFVGVFFPIGLIFTILFLNVNILILLIIVPIFLFALNYLCKKFVKVNMFFIGILQGTKKEKRTFEQFLSFLEGFAIKLSNNISPEKSFIMHYSEKKDQLLLLRNSIGYHVSQLTKLSCSFNEMIDNLKLDLKNLRYKIILNTIKLIIVESAYVSADRIFEILNLIDKHRKLEDKFEAELRSNRFKVFAFSVLLPIITGAVCGMMPFLSLFSLSIDFQNLTVPEYFSMINIVNAIIIFIAFIFCNSITCYHFLKVIKFKSFHIILLFSNITFTIAFFVSLISIINI